MAYEQRDNSGTIFVNDRKEKETHPDRSGTAMIGGVMYYVSGWIKEGAKGKFLSLSFKRKEGQPHAIPVPEGFDHPRAISQQAQAAIRKPDPISSGLRRDDLDDSIPF